MEYLDIKYIKQSTKRLINKSSMWLLALAFKSDTMIKSKTMTFIVKEMLLCHSACRLYTKHCERT